MSRNPSAEHKAYIITGPTSGIGRRRRDRAGFNPTTGLGGGDVSAFVRFVQRFVVPLLAPLLMPFIKILSTPKRAAREIAKILIDSSGHTGVYYDEGGHPMQASALVRDPKYQDRVVAETRAFLAAHSE
jgi:hypothetical protein